MYIKLYIYQGSTIITTLAGFIGNFKITKMKIKPQQKKKIDFNQIFFSGIKFVTSFKYTFYMYLNGLVTISISKMYSYAVIINITIVFMVLSSINNNIDYLSMFIKSTAHNTTKLIQVLLIPLQIIFLF